MPPKTRGGSSTGIRTSTREVVDLAHEVMQVPLQEACEPAATTSEGTSQANILFSLEPKATDIFFKMDVLMRFVEFGRDKFGVFKGQADPWEAYRWLRDVTETFDIMECPGEKRVKFAVFFLADDAKDWWESTTIALGTNSSSWEAFLEAFKEEYFSRSIQHGLLSEFINLYQDGRPVSQYIVEFQILADMFPNIVSTARARSDHFFRGLDPRIQMHVISVSSENFKEMVKMARRAEKCEKKFAQKSMTPPESQSSGYEPSFDGSQPTKKACYHCGVVGHLARACPLNEVQCYFCKEMGHYKSHCPHKGK